MNVSGTSTARHVVATSAILAAVMLFAPTVLLGQQKPPDTKSAEQVVYKPPLRGAPGGRVGGGTRGTGREAFVLSVLAPNHTGLTTSEQPSLYWFISTTSSYPIEVTLVHPDKTDPLIEMRVPPPVAAGVHRIRLADHNVKLDPAVAYQWYVAVVPDGGRRSKDILAGGSIERVSVPADLPDRVSKTSKSELPRVYADAGLWYDAMSAIGDQIEQAPSDQALRDQRSALLRQVGLPDVNH
jgi:hypothetical protein